MSKQFNWGINKTLSKDPEVVERLSHLSEVKFVFGDEKPIPETYSCFKIFVGRKYFIAKTKTCMWLETHLNKMLKQYNSKGLMNNDIYFPIVKHIHNTGYYECRIEFICQSDNPYEVIKAEFLELIDSRDKTLCINKDAAPYIPKFNSKTNMFGWLTRNQFLNYSKLLHKHNIKTD